MRKQKKTLGTESSGEVVEHKSVDPCSVSLSRDAKGNLKWEIKVYCESGEVESQARRLLNLDKEIREEVKKDAEN